MSMLIEMYAFRCPSCSCRMSYIREKGWYCISCGYEIGG